MTTRSIGTGGYYSTIQAWFDDAPASLVAAADNWIGECLNQHFSVGGYVLQAVGKTTSAAYHFTLTAAAGAAWCDNANVQSNAFAWNTANGAAISGTYNYRAALLIQEPYTVINRLQVRHTDRNTAIHEYGGHSYIDVDQCIIQAYTGRTIILFGTEDIVRNSLLVQTSATAAYNAQLGGAAKAYGCTFVTPSNITKTPECISQSYGACSLTNCAIFGATNVATANFTPTCTNCYADDTTPPTGCTTVTYDNSLFVDTTGDWRLPSGSTLIDAGTTDSTYEPHDAPGTSRPQGSAYDVGAWEYVSAAANAPQFMMMGVG